MNFALRGEMGPATGWLGRAQRLVEQVPEDCVERGYLLMPVAFQHDAAGDFEGASATAAAAVEIGERFGDRDLFALAMHGQGGWLIKAGRVREGLGLLDEAMVAATSGELSPIVTGIVYCGVIAACEEVYDRRRAQEWTAALKAVVRPAARPDVVHRAVHGPPRRDHAIARCVDGRGRGGAARGRALRARDEYRSRGEGVLPAGRRPPAARRAGCRGGRVQGSEPLRLGASAGARPAAARAGQRRRRCRRDPSRPGRDDGHAAAREPPPGVRPDHARRRRRRSSARGVPRARGDLGAVRERRAGRDARPGAGSGRACRRSTRRPRSRRFARRRRRGRSSRRLTRPRGCACCWGSRAAPLGDEDAFELELDAARETLRRAGRGSRRGLGRLARRTAPSRRRARIDAARARGAAPRRHRQEQPRDRRGARASASTPSRATCRTSSPSSACRRARPRARSRSSTTSSSQK